LGFNPGISSGGAQYSPRSVARADARVLLMQGSTVESGDAGVRVHESARRRSMGRGGFLTSMRVARREARKGSAKSRKDDLKDWHSAAFPQNLGMRLQRTQLESGA
jgi:hypothetical protein